jgi:D-xylose transport system ATP-binding protein
VGREIGQLFPRRAPAQLGDVVLKVDHLFTETTVRALPYHNDISFAVRGGEVLGIGGLMGAGRTELIMHLFGAWGWRTGGHVTLNGQAFDHPSPVNAIRRGMVLVSEDRKRYGLVLEESVGFNFSLSSLWRVSHAGFIDDEADVRRGQQMFEALHVKATGLEATVGRLSGGNQQKVVLGKALLAGPNLVLLDEPTRGIDVGAKLEVYELINRLTDEGKAVILISSELPELIGMSDRIVMLSEGRVGGEFTRAEATPERLLAAAMAGRRDAVREQEAVQR